MERLRKNHGFSALELVIVILILIILVITVYFKWVNSPINLYTQAALLANDIRYTQNLSMSQNQRFRLAITSSTTYQIQNSAGNSVVKPSASATTTLTSGITFGTPTGITSKIIFNNKGVPYGDNPVSPLTQQAVIPLTSNNKTAPVTIYPETGRVTS